MRQKKTFLWTVMSVMLCSAMIFSACTKEGAGNGSATPSDNTPAATAIVTAAPEATPSPVPQDSVTPTVEVTPANSPSPTPTAPITPQATVTPTITPNPKDSITPIPAVEYGSLEQIRHNRELHEIINPKREPAQTGTAPALTEQDRQNISHGISRINPIRTARVVLGTGEEPLVNEYGLKIDGQILTLHVSGIKDPAVAAKINDRIDETVAALSDPDYLPDMSGILSYVKEWGPPEVEVSVEPMDQGGVNGFFSVRIRAYREWTEIRTVASYEEAEKLLYENWPCNTFGFRAAYSELEEESEPGSMKMEFWHEIMEVVGLNFNLATGEELTLSDFFPAGEDYPAYLNEEIERQLRENSFWFRDDDYQESGEINPPRGSDPDHDGYRETMEYDSGAVFTGLKGTETFYSYCSGLYFPGVLGDEISIDIPQALPDLCQGKDVFLEKPGYRFSSLGMLDMCEMLFDCAVRETVAGQLRIPADGGKEQEVTVYKGDDPYPRWYHIYGEYPGEPERVIERYYTDEEMLAFIGEWLTKEWPREKKLLTYSPWYEDVENFTPRSVVATSIRYFPNGYACVSLELGENVKGENDDNWNRLFLNMWVKDGKYISRDDIYDVSPEELLTELLADLCTEDGKKAMTPEEAGEAAKALSQYVMEYDWDEGVQTCWDWGLIDFPWGSVYNISASKVDRMLPKDVLDHIPEILLKNLISDYDVHVYLYPSDPYLYMKHLLMYEGYTFE